MKRFFLFLAFLTSIVIPWPALAATYPASSCSQAHIQAAVDLAVNDGDIVTIPACTSTNIDTEVIITGKAITIQGAGVDSTILNGNNRSYHIFYLPSSNTKAVTLKDMTITATYHLLGGGAPRYACGGILIDGGNNFRITNIKFDYSTHQGTTGSTRGNCAPVRPRNGVYGLIDYNIFIDPFDGVYISGSGNTAWAEDTNFGDEKAVYVQYNTITYNTDKYGAFIEGGVGHKVVARYNDFTTNSVSGGFLGQHDFCSNGSRGARRAEVYHNTITTTVYNTDAMQIMGGTAVVWQNRFIGFSSPGPIYLAYRRSCPGAGFADQCTAPANSRCGDGSAGSLAVDLYDDSTGYRCHDQPGMGKDQVSEPIYFWNNCSQVYTCSDTVPGCTCGGSGYVVGASLNPAYTCSSPALSDHIQADRDYRLDTYKDGYIPLGDHPLSNDTTAPVLSGLLPATQQQCLADPEDVVLSLDTDEPATCRHHATSTTWASMVEMDTTGSSSHSTTVNYGCNASYTRKVVCQDGVGNESAASTWSFSIAGLEASGKQIIAFGTGSQKVILPGIPTIGAYQDYGP